MQLPIEDAHSLYWSQLLSLAWATKGRAALESHDLPTAETYLRAAWHLDQERHTGYQLGRLLEVKGDKAAAAHQYLLCRSATIINPLNMDAGASDVDQKLSKSYRRLAGKDIDAPSVRLPGGKYTNSPRAELDRETDLRHITQSSKLTGSALFSLSFEPGKSTDVRFLGGDASFKNMTAAVKSFVFHPSFPTGSKARILREMRLVCTPYAGCDGYMMLPTSIEFPPVDITPSNSPKGAKVVRLEVAPPE
jgi:hypothetical protein